MRTNLEFSEAKEAEDALWQLAGVFLKETPPRSNLVAAFRLTNRAEIRELELSDVNARYRALVEQIPAVVFMAHLDHGVGEAYVSPQIEAALGFSQQEWLEDPVRWFHQIHPDDKLRWSTEVAEMFLSGQPLRSAYRVMARDGRVVWFHCEAKMIREPDGHPGLIHGVAFDISDLKSAEEALQNERNFVSAILGTVGALVVVMDSAGRIVRFNRACEEATGYSFRDVKGRLMWDLLVAAEEQELFREHFEQIRSGHLRENYESRLTASDGEERLIAWSTTVLDDANGSVGHVIASGVDITESKRLEKAILEISAREQRRIGQDLHDGLGQLLTGIAFLSKALEQKLADQSLPAAADATKLVSLVNEAIHVTRELSRGLLPVFSEAEGLMSALERWASEVEDVFSIICRFQCEAPVLVHDNTMATHLYHIAQESVNNAIRHGNAGEIEIGLTAREREAILSIADDGKGIPSSPSKSLGMGLHIMKHRARLIGGTLSVQPNSRGGTTVSCTFPLDMQTARRSP